MDERIEKMKDKMIKKVVDKDDLKLKVLKRLSEKSKRTKANI